MSDYTLLAPNCIIYKKLARKTLQVTTLPIFLKTMPLPPCTNPCLIMNLCLCSMVM